MLMIDLELTLRHKFNERVIAHQVSVPHGTFVPKWFRKSGLAEEFDLLQFMTKRYPYHSPSKLDLDDNMKSFAERIPPPPSVSMQEALEILSDVNTACRNWAERLLPGDKEAVGRVHDSQFQVEGTVTGRMPQADPRAVRTGQTLPPDPSVVRDLKLRKPLPREEMKVDPFDGFVVKRDTELWQDERKANASHALQRVVDQPGGFGQTRWEPWRKA